MNDTVFDDLGNRVREVWIGWAAAQPDPKPSWLVPYAELSKPLREVDRRIGVALWTEGFLAAQRFYKANASGHTVAVVEALLQSREALLRATEALEG